MKKFFVRYSMYLMPIFSFLIIGFALEIMMCYGISLYMINCSRNTLFSREAVTVSIKGSDCFDFSDIGSSSILRINKDTAFSAYEIVCFDGFLNVGDGIAPNKSTVGTNSAVVGSEVGSFADLSELVISGKKYNIIEEFNDKRVPSNNCAVFYFGDSVCETKDNVFIIDGMNKHAIAKTLEQLKEKARSCNASVEIVQDNKVGVRNFIKGHKTLPILFILYFAVLGFNDAMICIFHTEQLKRIVSVNVLLGKRRPMMIVFRSLLLFMLCSSAASAVMVRIIIGQSRDVLCSLGITVIFLGVINTMIALIYRHKLINNSCEILMELCNE